MQAKANRSQTSLNSFGSSTSLYQLATPSRPSLSVTVPSSPSPDISPPSERPALTPLVDRNTASQPGVGSRSRVIIYPHSPDDNPTNVLAPPQPAFARPERSRQPSHSQRLSTAANAAASHISTALATYFADPASIRLPESNPNTPPISRNPSFDLSRLAKQPETGQDPDEEIEKGTLDAGRTSPPPASPRVGYNSEEAQRQRDQARLQAILANSGNGSPFAQSSWRPAPFRSVSNSVPASPSSAV